jgi:hypothetical protein
VAAEPAWEFDWNESNLRHLARHRISQAEFEQAMRGDPVFMDIRYKGGEERWYPLGATEVSASVSGLHVSRRAHPPHYG